MFHARAKDECRAPLCATRGAHAISIRVPRREAHRRSTCPGPHRAARAASSHSDIALRHRHMLEQIIHYPLCRKSFCLGGEVEQNAMTKHGMSHTLYVR